MRTLGVDVSHWEGNINWHIGYSWLGFAYYKATDGEHFIDSQLGLNMDECNDVGIPHAPYHWFQPSEDPIAQARHFIDTTEGGGYHRYIADFEQPGCTASNMKAFLDECTRLTGIKPAIYTSYGFWISINPRPTWSNQYDLIVAHYTGEHNPTLPIGWSTWRIWQFSDYWYFPGCELVADADWFNGTLQQCRDWFGNYRQVDPPVYQMTRLRSQFDGLHIRSLPKVSAREVGHLTKDEVIELEELGGAEVWVKHTRGWTAVERNGYRYMEVIK